MESLNLGVLAHVDAGKTSLAERLLYVADVIDRPGRVDDGSTQTDSLDLEQQRGITIRSGIVAFAIGNLTVNLIDTPGHADFIAEVERALDVLDGAVLVVSAVEGVQAQTRVLMRTLKRLQVPTLIFVNKVDRATAAPDDVFDEIRETLTPHAVDMRTNAESGWVGRAAEVLADLDGAVLADVIDRPEKILQQRITADLARHTRAAHTCPVFFGSAITGAGSDELTHAIAAFLPSVHSDALEPPSGTVFKIERGPTGERIVYVRMTSGALHVRELVSLPGGDEAKLTAVSPFEPGGAVARSAVHAGQIARVRGLPAVRVGDVIGAHPRRAEDRHQFSPPSLETVVDPLHQSDQGALHAALTQLEEQDPLINLRQDDGRREISVSLYGEVQKEVVQATIEREYGVRVTFRQSTTICVERVVGSGAAVEFIDTDPNPYLATVGLRVEPAPAGSGVTLFLEVERGSMPRAFFAAVEQAVRETLEHGRYGWSVIDCSVTMTHSGYWARQSHSHGTFDASMSSTAGDFRGLTPVVLTEALRQATTEVLEPIHRFELKTPGDSLGPVLSALAHVRAVPLDTQVRHNAYVVSGDIPAARVHDLRQLLPAATNGEGEFVTYFERYQTVHGRPPSRS